MPVINDASMTKDNLKGPEFKLAQAIKKFPIAGFYVWLAWSLFAAAFLGHGSGTIGSGGFPVAYRAELQDFLTSRAFSPDPAFIRSDGIQRFRGSFQGSCPFFVNISTKASDTYSDSLYIETTYDFHGLTWRVNDSSKKAREFAGTLDRWLTERSMRDARL